MKTSKTLMALVLAGLMGSAVAKLPPPTDEQKAKAEEAKAKAAETAKMDAELLGKAQDRAASNWAARAKAQGKEFKPTPIVAATPAPAPAPAAAAPAASAPAASAPAASAPAAAPVTTAAAKAPQGK